jgi:hypothetical protein
VLVNEYRSCASGLVLCRPKYVIDRMPHRAVCPAKG